MTTLPRFINRYRWWASSLGDALLALASGLVTLILLSITLQLWPNTPIQVVVAFGTIVFQLTTKIPAEVLASRRRWRRIRDELPPLLGHVLACVDQQSSERPAWNDATAAIESLLHPDNKLPSELAIAARAAQRELRGLGEYRSYRALPVESRQLTATRDLLTRLQETR